MASTGLNFSNLTPDNGAVQSLKQLIFLSVLATDKLGSVFNILPGQKHGQKVGMIGEFGMLGTAGKGCNPTFNTSILAASEKEWSIKEWEIAEKICYKDLEATLAKTALKTKTQIADLTGTEYMDDILMPRLELAVMKMLMRLAWFGDEGASNISDGGVLTAGVDKKFFTVTDGFWKRIFAVVAKKAERKTAIAANSQTTFALQKSKLLESGVATGILDQLIMDAPMVLRGADNQVIYITQSLKDALDADIKKNNKGSELQWNAVFAGIKETEYSGIKVMVLPFWDEIIRSCEASETAWNKPHRAIYTVQDNLMVGLESTDEVAEIDVWFNKDEQMNKILAKDKLGTIIAQDDLIQVAY